MLPEQWDPLQFMTTTENSFTIKQPYLQYANKLSFKFDEYNSNMKMQCAEWMRMSIQCLNMYGKEMRMHVNCQEVTLYLNQCIRINSFISRDRKYFPERYLYGKDAFIDPHYDHIFLPGDQFK
jgi:hypothetical protein